MQLAIEEGMAITLWLKFCSGIHWILIIYQKVHTHACTGKGMGAWQVKSPRPSGWITKFTFIPAQSVNYDNDKDVKTNARMGTKCDGFMLSACVIEGGGRGRGGQLDMAQVSHWNAQFLSLIQWILTQQFVVKVKRSDWGDYWPKCSRGDWRRRRWMTGKGIALGI